MTEKIKVKASHRFKASAECTATIIHEMDAKWVDYVSQTENGWSCMMQATDVLLEN